ncbi:hypothetical protein [Alkalicoccus halolimnae]|uniref:Uncharacterized protein n=1 Tax=Alkalicoccus halolimnae TaxID=1667239 RepID=A0A5C7FAS5_9BACI|nr:hypothetical protein [Alkalicoccus halolimnae]TXF83330.1 hypothetical protein FTX54_13205 [Alkalicoccus halolimnae]
MVLPSQGGNNELESMIRKVTGRKKFKDRKPIFNILDILILLTFIAIPVIYNTNPEMIIDPFAAWIFVLSFFCFKQAVEGHVEGFKYQRIAFLIMGGANLLFAIAFWIIVNQ